MGERMRWRLGLVAFYALVVAALRLAQALRFEWEGFPALVSLVILALVLGLEIGLTIRFEGARLRRSGARVRSLPFLLAGVGLLGRLAFWAFVFWFAVEYPGSVDRGDEDVFMRGVPLRLWEFAPGLLAQLGWLLAVPAAILWLAAMEFIVVRRRRLRGTVFLVVPAVLLAAATLLSYQLGTRMAALDDVLQQPDVDLLYAPGPSLAEKKRLVWDHPRSVRLLSDGHTVLMSFGKTLGGQRGAQPNLWKIDLETGAVRTLETEFQVWAYETDPAEETLYAFVWHGRYILAVDLESFEERARIPLGDHWPYPAYEPVHTCAIGSKLIFSTSAIPSLLLFDMTTERILDKLDLAQMGILSDGSMCCGLRRAGRDGSVYALASDDDGTIVLVVDPGRFEVRSVVRMPVITRFPSVWERDGASDLLLLPGEFSNDLWTLDPTNASYTLRLEQEGIGPSHVVHDPTTGLVWVVSRSSGRLAAMGEDFSTRRAWDVGPASSELLLAGDYLYLATKLGLFRLPRRSGALGSVREPD